MKRSGPPKRKTPLARSGRVKPVNRERRDERHARNFAEEAERVRGLPCLCVQKGREVWAQKMGRHNPCCRGDVVAAHVTARGMGASKGGRFDLVPLCDAHHDEQGVAGVQTFAARYGLDLRAEADAVALEHPRPLGIRGLADRWAAFEDAANVQLDTYEWDALTGWVRREMARAVQSLRDVLSRAALTGDEIAELSTGRVALYEHVGIKLGLPSGVALGLCEAAGWPS